MVIDQWLQCVDFLLLLLSFKYLFSFIHNLKFIYEWNSALLSCSFCCNFKRLYLKCFKFLPCMTCVCTVME